MQQNLFFFLLFWVLVAFERLREICLLACFVVFFLPYYYYYFLQKFLSYLSTYLDYFSAHNFFYGGGGDWVVQRGYIYFMK